MSSFPPEDRRPAPGQPPVGGKKRPAADDAIDSDHVKRLNRRPPSTPPGRSGDGKRDESGARNQSRLPESPALRRRSSLNNERSHPPGFSSLTRTGTSPGWETNARVDDYSIRGRASFSAGPSRGHDTDPASRQRTNADRHAQIFPQLDTRRDPRRMPKEPDSEPGSFSRSAVAGSRSGSSTPRAAMTPISSEMPALSTDTPNSSKSFARMLTDYTNGIISTTQSVSRYDSAQRRLHRSRRDDKRWHERYSDFAALEEMQNRILIGTEKKTSKLEKKVCNVRKSHKQITALIASKLVQQNGGSIPSRSNECQHFRSQSEAETSPSSTERIKADMTRLRGDVENLTITVNKNMRSDIELGADRQDRLQEEFNDYKSRWSSQFDGVKRDFSSSRIDNLTLRAYERDAAELKISTSRAISAYEMLDKRTHSLEATVTEIEAARLGPRIHEADKKAQLALETAERNVNQARDRDASNQETRLQALEITNETYGKDIADVKEAMSQDSKNLRSLKDVVLGDGGSNGASLLDMIRRVQEDADKFRNAVSVLDTAMDEYESERTAMKTCVDGLSEQLAVLQIKQSDALKEVAAQPEAVSKVTNDITQLQEAIAQMNREQDEKDDIVNEDVERLDKELIRQGDNLNKLSESLQVNVAQSRNVSEDSGFNKALPQQPSHTKIEELHGKLIEQETSIANILEKIGSLNIEIQSLPKEEHIQRIQQVQSVLRQHESTITDMGAKVDVLQSQAVSRHSVPRSPHLPNGIGGLKEVNPHAIEALENKQQIFKQEFDGLQSDYQQFKESTTDTTSNHDTFIVSLQQRFDNLTTDHMIRCMLHQLQSLYPHHPGNVQNQFHQLDQRQTLSERQIVQLVNKMKQIDSISGNIEMLRHQIALRATESAKLTQEAHEKSIKQIENGKTDSTKLIEDSKAYSVRLIESAKEQSTKLLATDIEEGKKESIRLFNKAKEDFQQRINDLQGENVRLIENAKEQSTKLLATDIEECKKESIRLFDKAKEDFQQRIKVLQEECQESHSILEQDIHNHLERIQSLQKSRTDQTNSITAINKEIQEIHSSLKAHQIQSENSVSALQSDLTKTNVRITDAETAFTNELASEHSALIELGGNIEALNARVRMFRQISMTPNGGPADDVHSSQEDRDVQLSQGATNTSMSLGQPSSPIRPSASTETDQTVRQESSDSEPIITPITKRGLKRRRRGGSGRGGWSAENSPRGKRGR